jgi:hypothetical protein
MEQGMKDASLVCFVIAGILAYNGLEGWGWFLLIGLLLS